MKDLLVNKLSVLTCEILHLPATRLEAAGTGYEQARIHQHKNLRYIQIRCLPWWHQCWVCRCARRDAGLWSMSLTSYGQAQICSPGRTNGPFKYPHSLARTNPHWSGRKSPQCSSLLALSPHSCILMTNDSTFKAIYSNITKING